MKTKTSSIVLKKGENIIKAKDILTLKKAGYTYSEIAKMKGIEKAEVISLLGYYD